jgi:hypothetical protein
LPICTRLTEPNMKPLLAVGHRSMPWAEAEVMETMYKWLAFIVMCWNMVCLLFWGWFCEGLNFIRMNDISCSSKLWFGGWMEIIYGKYVVLIRTFLVAAFFNCLRFGHFISFIFLCPTLHAHLKARPFVLCELSIECRHRKRHSTSIFKLWHPAVEKCVVYEMHRGVHLMNKHAQLCSPDQIVKILRLNVKDYLIGNGGRKSLNHFRLVSLNV